MSRGPALQKFHTAKHVVKHSRADRKKSITGCSAQPAAGICNIGFAGIAGIHQILLLEEVHRTPLVLGSENDWADAGNN